MLMTRLVTATVAVLLLTSVPAWADAVSYKGVWGEQQIVVELTEATDGPIVGRYSVLANGWDVPLRALEQSDDTLLLAEELPCTPDICVKPDDGLFLDAPLGARWDLQFSADGQTLSGLIGADDTNPGMPVVLQRIGSRSYERYDAFTYDYFVWNDYNGAVITPLSTPYDYAKMLVPLTEGPLMALNGGSVRFVSDPRTRFEFPRVVSLPDGGQTSAINRALDEQRWSTNLEGFGCLSMNYLSAGWTGDNDSGYSDLGDIDLESISVEYLSSRIMAIVQSGSTYCGGASPYNHSNYSTFDVRTGEKLDLSRIFVGWVPTRDGNEALLADARVAPNSYDWGANDALVQFVEDNRIKDPAYDLDCDIERNIGENLDISFRDNDLVVFLIAGIDQAACAGEVLAMPFSQLPASLLTPKAVDYFAH